MGKTLAQVRTSHGSFRKQRQRLGPVHAQLFLCSFPWLAADILQLVHGGVFAAKQVVQVPVNVEEGIVLQGRFLIRQVRILYDASHGPGSGLQIGIGSGGYRCKDS